MTYSVRHDVLRRPRTHLLEDIATTRTSILTGTFKDEEPLVLYRPTVAYTGDILKIEADRSLLDRLLRRRPVEPELVHVTFAGGVFTWVKRTYGGSTAQPWRAGDRVTVVGNMPVERRP
jgi:hypothetical protein